MGSAIKEDGGLKTCVCVFLLRICLHREPVWCSDITLATRIARMILSRGMASTNIQPIDISGSKSELSERWRVWMRGFTYFGEEKANLQNAARKSKALLYRAGSGVQEAKMMMIIYKLFEH